MWKVQIGARKKSSFLLAVSCVKKHNRQTYTFFAKKKHKPNRDICIISTSMKAIEFLQCGANHRKAGDVSNSFRDHSWMHKLIAKSMLAHTNAHRM